MEIIVIMLKINLLDIAGNLLLELVLSIYDKNNMGVLGSMHISGHAPLIGYVTDSNLVISFKIYMIDCRTIKM